MNNTTPTPLSTRVLRRGVLYIAAGSFFVFFSSMIVQGLGINSYTAPAITARSINTEFHALQPAMSADEFGSKLFGRRLA